MKLEDIGFYTLSDARAKQANMFSPLWRAELILTDRCNFKCPYCRGLRSDLKGTMDFTEANRVLDLWIKQGLKNVRFSGGEPTLYVGLNYLVKKCKDVGVEHIAISTNGSASLIEYVSLINAGVNDFSISLDAGCCAIGDKMAGGVKNSWEHTINIIKKLSKLTYVTTGLVFTEDNLAEAVNTVKLADSLGVADIRVIPAAQYNKAIESMLSLPEDLINRHPILKYRVEQIRAGKHVRGTTINSCPLVLDDMAVAAGYHFPCVIYMREGGEPIGKVGENMRKERACWHAAHNTANDPICSKNCLDVCVAYNKKWINGQ